MTACAFTSYVYLFQKSVFIKWWNRRRGSRKQNFLRCPTMVGSSLQNSSKTFSVNFTIQQWYLCEFLGKKKEKKKNKKSLNLCFYHYQVFSKYPRENKLEKRAIYHKVVWKLDSLFKLIATDTFISFGESAQLMLPR